MDKTTIAMAASAAVVFVCFFSWLIGIIVMLLWNWLVPILVPGGGLAATINFWQAWGLVVLIHCLFPTSTNISNPSK